MDKWLGPEGPFATGLNRYEQRPGQVAMANAVEKAFTDDGILLCEAPTGTGKTLAYLLPALLSERRVVISTASKALQEQIFFNDLPVVERALGRPAEAQLVKGLSNYLCLRRFDELKRGLSPRNAAVNKVLPMVEQWAAGTHEGDLAELDELPEDHPIVRLIASSSETRVGSGCPFFERCHVTRLRRHSEQARLLVVNHHLFFADLALKSGEHNAGVLPDYDAVILDEAHRIEDIATQFFGVEVSSSRIERLVKDAKRAYAGQHEASRLAELVGTLAESFLGEVNVWMGQSRDSRRALAPEHFSGERLGAYHALDDTLAALEGDLERSASETPIAASLMKRTADLRESLRVIVEPDTQRVVWAERNKGLLKLSSSPIEVGDLLVERLFDRGDPVVLTSASLTTNGKFDFLRSRLGLDRVSDMPVEQLSAPSSLDYEEQSLLYAPDDLPSVDDASFVASASKRVRELIEMTPGGAFVLCTSFRVVKAMSEALQESLKTTVLVQGQLPKTALLDEFKRDEQSTLVASMSFWEGVDVPGSALRLVVIDRIPFPVPSDPLVLARGEGVKLRGQSPFIHYQLPQAALTLKQGFGRLLRSRSDDGVVAILDGRFTSRRYSKMLSRSLPPAKRTSQLEDVEAFFSARRKSPATV